MMKRGTDPHPMKTPNRYTFCSLCEKPELKDAAAAWFHARWCVPETASLACMDSYLERENEPDVRPQVTRPIRPGTPTRGKERKKRADKTVFFRSRACICEKKLYVI